ncbi:hypothetical protein JCM11641_004289 [Rhodosporidiobolus odoratus]
MLESDDGALSLEADGDVHGSDTSKEYDRLRKGFLAYSIASEVFIIVSGTLFLPVVLETFARSNGRLSPQHEADCPPSGVDPAARTEEDAQRCDVQLLGLWMDTASFSLLTYSASVLLQALTVISMGSLADDPHIRHRLLTLFAFCGSASTILFLLLPENSVLWPLCTLLAAVANVSFGVTLVCLNSYLPELGRSSPAARRAYSSLLSARSAYNRLHVSSSSSSEDLQSASDVVMRTADAHSAARGLATSRLSSRAIAAGYAAGIGALAALLPVVSALGGGEAGTWPLRVAIAASGVWWLLGTIPAIYWLRPPSRRRDDYPEALRNIALSSQVKQGWQGLGKMLGEWKKLPQTFVFLAAWFVLSDCFATLTSTAMLFAKTSLGLSTSSLILIAILTPLSGIFGAVAFPLLQKRGFARNSSASVSAARPVILTNHHMLLLLVASSALIPLWGLLSLRSPAEVFLLACVFGALYGSFQSYSRTCFAELVPASQSARWFGLYSITDKSSSFLGPALVAGITNVTGQIRHGFYIIFSLLVLALPILAKVDMKSGSAAAEEYDREAKTAAGRAGTAEEEEPLYSQDGDEERGL